MIYALPERTLDQQKLIYVQGYSLLCSSNNIYVIEKTMSFNKVVYQRLPIV